MGRLVELGLLRPCGPRKQMKSIENWLVLFYWWGGRNLKIFDFQWRGPRSSTNQLFLLSLIKQSKDICFIDGGEESCWRAALPARSIAAPSRAVKFVSSRGAAGFGFSIKWVMAGDQPSTAAELRSNKFNQFVGIFPLDTWSSWGLYESQKRFCW